MTDPWLNRPLFLDARYAEVVVNAAAAAPVIRTGPGDEDDDEPEYAAARDRALAQFVPAVVREDSRVAIVSVTGLLSHRLRATFFGGRTITYLGLAALFESLRDDAGVRGVLLDLDTPGGDVAGLFELTLAMGGLGIPVWAAVNDMALSAGYAIAAVADRIQASASALVGSIGVLAVHVDQSKLDEQIGLNWTLITGGARKGDGDPHRPLSDPARSRLQSIVDHYYGLLIDHVALARNLDPDDVRATEAQTYTAPEALELGLIDSIAGFNATLAALEEEVSPSTPTSSVNPLAAASSPRSHAMSGRSTPAGQEAAGTTYTQDQLDRAVQAAVDEATGRVQAESRATAVQTERERINSILGHAAAEGRTALAQHLALETELPAEQAIGILERSPAEAAEPVPETSGSAFEQAMHSLGNADVGADADTGEDDSDEVEAKRVISLYRSNRPAA